MGFAKATKRQAKGRMALIGPSGSGKTWTSLLFATVLADGGKVAVIDSENESASKYADEFEFDTCPLHSFSPRSYVDAMHEAQELGYAALVIDSLSHAWTGKDGVLAMVDNATSRAKSGNAFTTGWREVTPQHNAMVEALVRCKCHLFVTMRTKTEYVIEEANGKKVPRKVGMAPVQRDGLEYEFDVVGDMDWENTLFITKSRCRALSGQVYRRPGEDVAKTFRAWLDDGTAPPAVATPGPVADATEEQIVQVKELLEVVTLPPDTVDKWFHKAGVFRWADMPAEAVDKCIAYLKARLPQAAAAR